VKALLSGWVGSRTGASVVLGPERRLSGQVIWVWWAKGSNVPSERIEKIPEHGVE